MGAREVIFIAAVVLVSTSCTSTGSPVPSLTASPSAVVVESNSPSAGPAGISGTYEVNGRDVTISCAGSGTPAFVIEAGEGMSTNDFSVLRAELATRGTACSYRRAVAESGTRTGAEIVDDLHLLLAEAGVPRPVVLIGHSAGGMFVQLYARLHPEDVSGIVSMNSVPPWGPWSDEAFAVMTEEERGAETAYFGGQNGESLDYRTTSEQLDAAPAPPDHPFRMLIADITQCEGVDICGRVAPAYESIMRGVAESWPAGSFVLLEAGHEIFLDDLPAVMRAVDEVTAAGAQS